MSDTISDAFSVASTSSGLASSSSSPRSSSFSPGSIPPTSSRPPTRAELAAWASILRSLEAKEQRPLGQRLLRRTTARVARKSRFNLDNQASGAEAGYDDDAHQHRIGNAHPKRTYSREAVRDLEEEDTDDRWPLCQEESRPSPHSLHDLISSIASVQIRKRNLHLPGQISISAEQDDDLVLPSDLTRSTIDFINRILVSLAGMRPIGSSVKRKQLALLGRTDVLNATSVLFGEQDTVLAANKRLRTLYGEDEETDTIGHHLDILAAAKAKRQSGFLDTLYAPAVPPPPKLKRHHQSKAEVAKRDSKRAAKMAERQERDAAKMTRKLARNEQRAAKRKKNK